MTEENTNVNDASIASYVTVAVTDEMLIEASHTGDLEQLRVWASQCVRVKTGDPLCAAAIRSFPNVAICLVQELGAEVDKKGGFHSTALIVAAQEGKLDVVKYLVESGASIELRDNNGSNALIGSARCGEYSTMRYLLEHAGANIDDVDDEGDTVWDELIHRVQSIPKRDNDNNHDPAALAGLLRYLVLRAALPPAVVAILPPEDIRVVQQGASLRRNRFDYLEQQRASIVAHCPLPGVFLPFVADYAAPTTEDMWTDGLRIWVIECSRSGCSGPGTLRCTACKQVRYYGQLCRQAHWKAHIGRVQVALRGDRDGRCSSQN
jgi:hypothetical protein